MRYFLLASLITGCIQQKCPPCDNQVTPVPTAIETIIPTENPTEKPTIIPTAIPTKKPIWPPVPAEDQVNGENDNAYYAAIGHPTFTEEKAYVEEISIYAKKYAKPAGIPASVVVAMACNESGFGFTRVGYNSNSIFSQKNWGCKWTSRYSNSCYSLIGQPDEFDGQIKIIKKTNKGVIYDEDNRPDNKYFAYPSREIAVKSLVEEWIVESNYPPEKKGVYSATIRSYKSNLAKGMSKYDAAIFFIRQLADLGYMHLGGEVYVQNLKPIIDKYDLVQKLD